MMDKLTMDLAPLGEAGDFPDSDYMLRICQALRFPAELASVLLEEAKRIGRDAERTEAAARFRRELFAQGRRSAEDVNRELLAFGADGAMLAAAVYTSAIPLLWERYRKQSIPAEVLIDTVQDIVIWMETHRKRHGRLGLSELNWLYLHMSGELFRLGRLQFHYIPSPFAIKVFRHGKTGETAILSEAELRYRADGQLDGTCGLHDPEGSWVSIYTFDGRHHEGNPISPLGAASHMTVSLSAEEWKLVLQKGDAVLNVHIPEGTRLAPESVRESYAKAAHFAAECFPDKPFRAFVCESWLLAPQFRELLSEDSNIVRFQSDYHLLPDLSDERQTLERVFGFGTTLADLPNVKLQTSLQRIVFEYLHSGGRIHNGGGFILAE